MSSSTIGLSEDLRKYLLGVSCRESKTLKSLRKETFRLKEARMQISPEQGSFLALLVKVLSAKKTLDIGVFTGYSSLVVADALPDDGVVIACDTSEEWTNIARKYWKIASVNNKIQLELAPAIKTLDKLIEKGEQGTFDFSFIDADKINYQNYLERSLGLLKPGGVVAIDNVLWGGKVLDEQDNEPATRAIRIFNEKLKDDNRVFISMVPIGDGLTLAFKK
ncbi:class I SAM-dependent methyltransferase [Candidatus Marinimicrobia bacterium]|nr:class I SAM-dependent methyltransferase [Candidatus Neomarinimicrobiota bacterium]